jgi:hypothetical protein
MPPRGKWPFLKFATGDWLKDPAVRSLDPWDRGVWFDMLCLMHEGEQRGKLLLNGRAIPDHVVARMLGLSYEDGPGDFNRGFKTTLSTLEQMGVVAREQSTNALMNRRMVRDEILHQIAVESGRRGGSPILKGVAPANAQRNGSPPAPPPEYPPPPQDQAIQSAAPGEVPQFETEQMRRERIKRERAGGQVAPTATVSRGSRMTKDWQIGPELADWIRRQAPGITKAEVDRLRDEFVDFWIGVPGKDGVKLDWDGTFRNKFRKYLDQRGGYGRGTARTAKSERINPGEFLAGLEEESAEGPGQDEE